MRRLRDESEMHPWRLGYYHPRSLKFQIIIFESNLFQLSNSSAWHDPITLVFYHRHKKCAIYASCGRENLMKREILANSTEDNKL